ncbi:ATP-binding cassette domain-containing protein [Mesorhizobium sp. VNQ89]|uniref:phosphonate ABC transporter ATP-binding protein n=1 Tax=Mesorhizobium quangtriensis TaxID=3157709 RepID=UPI0032B73A09
MPSSVTELDLPGTASRSSAVIESLCPPPTRVAALIETRDLVQRYAGASPVLDRIDLTIREGDTVALIGSNGAGKSTLLKTLVGLNAIDAGSVTIFGERFERRPGRSHMAAIRRQIGFVFQHHGLVRRQTALTNVVQGMLGMPGGWRAWHHAIAPAEWRDRAVGALSAVRLADKAQSRADRLSGGQAQRVAIARALVRQPRLLIADEPAASLDPATGHDVMRTFLEIAESTGTTLVFTSHDMEHALSYARRVIALKGGRVFLDAESRDLRAHDLEPVFRG